MKNLITLETSKTWLTKSESLGKNMQLKILTLVVCAWSICCSAEAVQSTTEEQSSPVPIVEPSRKVNSILLKGTVSDEIYPQLERRVQDLMQAALDRESDSALLGKRSARYNKVWSRVWAGTRDIAELLTEYKGFEQSSEAGDVLLGEKFKLKSKSSADCVQQLKRDHIEKEILTGILQIAQGLGCPEESDRKRGTELGLNQLKKLVGDDEAHKTLETLTNCCATIKVDPSVFDQKPLNVLEIEQQSSNVFEKALASDQVIGEITHIVHKYFSADEKCAITFCIGMDDRSRFGRRSKESKSFAS